MSDVLARLKATKVEEEDVLPIAVNRDEKFAATAKELLTIVASNPTHPKALEIKRAVRSLPANQMTACDKVDLVAIMDNCEVEIVEVIEDKEVEGMPVKVRVQTKRVGKKIEKQPDAPAPDVEE